MVRKDYEKFFTHLKPPEPPSGLFNRIIKDIRRERHSKMIKWRFGFFTVILISSLLAAIPAFRLTQASFAESGFAELFTLLFTDTSAIMVYWNSFIVALMESLPIMSIAIFLIVVFAFMESLKYVVRDFRVVFSPINAFN